MRAVLGIALCIISYSYPSPANAVEAQNFKVDLGKYDIMSSQHHRDGGSAYPDIKTPIKFGTVEVWPSLTTLPFRSDSDPYLVQEQHMLVTEVRAPYAPTPRLSFGLKVLVPIMKAAPGSPRPFVERDPGNPYAPISHKTKAEVLAGFTWKFGPGK